MERHSPLEVETSPFGSGTTATGATQHVLKGHTLWVWPVACSPNRKTLASAGGDGLVRIWDPAARRSPRRERHLQCSKRTPRFQALGQVPATIRRENRSKSTAR